MRRQLRILVVLLLLDNKAPRACGTLWTTHGRLLLSPPACELRRRLRVRRILIDILRITNIFIVPPCAIVAAVRLLLMHMLLRRLIRVRIVPLLLLRLLRRQSGTAPFGRLRW